MNKNDFVKLLEQYKNKAIDQLQKECEVSAKLLITPEFHELSEKIDEAAIKLTAAYNSLMSQFREITNKNPQLRSTYFSYSTLSTKMESYAINNIKRNLMDSYDFRKNETVIKNKFDTAIRSAKSTKSSKKLMELAAALGIEVDSIEVEGDVSMSVDVPYLKEKISNVKLLTT
jgi:hypothetical protein